MHAEILNEPFRVTLLGCGGEIGSDGISVSGKRYMDNMWQEVRERGVKTKGINHWVYLPKSTIFTGVELAEPTADPGTLEKIGLSLDRYLRHVHKGDYSTLPQMQIRLSRQSPLGKNPFPQEGGVEFNVWVFVLSDF